MADLRQVATGAALILAACTLREEGEAPVDPDRMLSCAVDGASSFARRCSYALEEDGAGKFLVIRHEDGGFRRLRIEIDGSGVSAADGADLARITLFDNEIEVEVGADRYLLPATVMDRDSP